MTTYWCTNFDTAVVLSHGLESGSWLAQYQYEHSGFEYQGNRNQKPRTTETWKSLAEVSVGDWLVAYLSGNAFYAIGQVRSPRKLENASQVHIDTVDRTVREARHLYLDGVVRYTDAEAFCEDFTDPLERPTEQSRRR